MVERIIEEAENSELGEFCARLSASVVLTRFGFGRLPLPLRWHGRDRDSARSLSITNAPCGRAARPDARLIAIVARFVYRHSGIDA